MNETLPPPKAATPLSDYDDGTPDAMSFGLLFRALWRAKRLVATIVFVCAVLAVLYKIFLAQTIYLASATIEPTSGAATASGAGLLAALSRGSMGANADQFQKYLQVIQSTRLAARIEHDHQVMERLSSAWDPATGKFDLPKSPFAAFKTWLKHKLGLPDNPQSRTTALVQMLSTQLDVNQLAPDASLLGPRPMIYVVTLKIPDHDYSVELLQYILRESDTLVREDQFRTTSTRMNYLTSMLNHATDVNARQNIEPIMLDQQSTLMTLKADRNYAFDMIDPPYADTQPVGASGVAILVLGMFIGLMLSGVAIYFIVRRRLDSLPANADPLAEPFPDPLDWLPWRGRARAKKERYA